MSRVWRWFLCPKMHFKKILTDDYADREDYCDKCQATVVFSRGAY